MMITERDLDALHRAMDWGEHQQKREPQIKLFPEEPPLQGTPAWFALAKHLAALAQTHTLALRPWQCEPVDVEDDAVADPNVYGCRPDEIALRRKMRALNISVFEPRPPAAIADAENAQHTAPRRPARKSKARNTTTQSQAPPRRRK
jgi:hypothetical protein